MRIATLMPKKSQAIKMPTNRNLFYQSGALSAVTWTGDKQVNMVRDFAAINRHNMAHTNSRGVPYVYRIALTTSCQVVGESYNQVFAEDPNMIQVAEIFTAPNTWVTRNAVVKTHAARENMFKLQGVKKSERGAYSRTIRPTWDADPDTFLTPQKGSASGGADYAMGTWDYSALKADDGDLNHLRLIGDGGLLSLYLDSRRQVDPDSNSEDDSENQPVDSNILRQLLSPTLGISAKDDDVITLGRDEQDNPPYSLDNDGDHTDPVLAGHQFIGSGAGLSSTKIYDVPLGIFELRAMNAFIDGGANKTIGMNLQIELLGIYEM